MSEDKIKKKTKREIKIMSEGGKVLAKIKKSLKLEIKAGVNAQKIDQLASKLIEESGAEPSFKMVDGYSWATCVNVNDGVVHGIPKKSVVFKKGDLISVDVGIFYQGFHTDTSFTMAISNNKKTRQFLSVGKKALKAAISKASVGNRIYDISAAMQKIIKDGGYSPIRALVGHGIGKELHEPPQIPCFVYGKHDESPVIQVGFVLAIEAMYSMGKPDVFVDADGWTIKASDGKITGLFEETVAVSQNGPIVLTD